VVELDVVVGVVVELDVLWAGCTTRVKLSISAFQAGAELAVVADWPFTWGLGTAGTGTAPSQERTVAPGSGEGTWFSQALSSKVAAARPGDEA
jgi:hypothetical protein